MNNLGKIIENSNLFPRSSNLLVAVSGGMDSMVLAHILFKLKYHISLVHVNYKLRGKDSDLDEVLVNAFAKQNGLQLHILKLNKFPGKSNLQEKARTIRYAYFEKIKTEFKYDYILTAHHIEDVLESFLYNLTRGAGLKGLKSIQQINDYFIRPLLYVDKETIKQYAIRNDVPYRIDKSNLTSDYDRNFLRNQIIPMLESRFPSFKKLASRSVRHLKTNYTFFNEAYNDWKRKNVVEFKQEKHILFNHHSNEVFMPQLLSDLEFHSETIYKIMEFSMRPGRSFRNKSGGCLVVDRNKLIYKENFEKSEFLKSITKKSRALKISNGSFQFFNMPVSKDTVLFHKLDRNIALFDADTLAFPLIVRNWKSGDRIKPLGMMGKSKKVQDVFTDCKLDLFEKSKIPIVCSGEQIIWIPGLMRSNLSLLNNQTKFVFKMVWNHSKMELL